MLPASASGAAGATRDCSRGGGCETRVLNVVGHERVGAAELSGRQSRLCLPVAVARGAEVVP